jgi:hypothetical protein
MSSLQDPLQDIVLALPAQPQQAHNNNLNVGMVHIVNNFVTDPVLESFSPMGQPTLSFNAQAVTHWANFFSQNRAPNLPSVEIPNAWSDFFTAILMSPAHYDWTRKFLMSQARKMIQSCTSDHGNIQFTLPQICPSKELLTCQNTPQSVQKLPHQ